MEQTAKNYQDIQLKSNLGFDIHFVTLSNNSPRHWHRELEILFILNGHATIRMYGEEFQVNPMDVIVMDFSAVHEVYYELPKTMGIYMHVSRQLLEHMVPNQELYKIRCEKEHLTQETKASYDRICEILKDLMVMYVTPPNTYQLRISAHMYNLLSELLENFSEPVVEVPTHKDLLNKERLEFVCDYVGQHYKEEITLQDMAEEVGLNREYFCRFFKQNMGISFVTYVNQVRLHHIYQDLIYTEDAILDIIERHGFLNQKLFYRMFKERYESSPREVRSIVRETPFR